jgi:LPS export ABC transporter protein LptC
MSMRLVLHFTWVATLLGAGCGAPENTKPSIYEGPVSEAHEVETFYNEKAAMKMKMIAKRVLEFQNGDREFPDGLYLEFYNEQGVITSTLRANDAYYFKKEDQWRGRGNVEVKNLEKKDQLNTEELFWKPEAKRIFTEKFVTIKQGRDVIYGTGLDAAQDLSEYTLKNPEGEFEVEEENK